MARTSGGQTALTCGSASGQDASPFRPGSRCGCAHLMPTVRYATDGRRALSTLASATVWYNPGGISWPVAEICPTPLMFSGGGVLAVGQRDQGIGGSVEHKRRHSNRVQPRAGGRHQATIARPGGRNRLDRRRGWPRQEIPSAQGADPRQRESWGCPGYGRRGRCDPRKLFILQVDAETGCIALVRHRSPAKMAGQAGIAVVGHDRRQRQGALGMLAGHDLARSFRPSRGRRCALVRCVEHSCSPTRCWPIWSMRLGISVGGFLASENAGTSQPGGGEFRCVRKYAERPTSRLSHGCMETLHRQQLGSAQLTQRLVCGAPPRRIESRYGARHLRTRSCGVFNDDPALRLRALRSDGVHFIDGDGSRRLCLGGQRRCEGKRGERWEGKSSDQRVIARQIPGSRSSPPQNR